MAERPTLLDLIVRYPRVAAAMAVFAVIGMVTGRAEIGVIAAVIVAIQVKKGALDFLSPDPSGYIDRSQPVVDTSYDERPLDERYEAMPRYAEAGMTPVEESAEDDESEAGPEGPPAFVDEEEDDDWIAPVAPLEVTTTRPASTTTYGIAVPKRKPVDVPRRR